MLAKANKNWEITLIAPSKFEWDINGSMIFGQNTISRGIEINDQNFKIIPVKIKNNKFLGWFSIEMEKTIIDINPDIIYHIGGHTQLSLFECLKIKQKLKRTKVLAFSMRGPTMDLHMPTMKRSGSLKGYVMRLAVYPIRKYMLNYFNTHTDAVLCHYPDALKCFRKEGYKGPIYISTQVGVDTDVFFPNQEYRDEIRKKYGLGNSFVFGCAARFVPYKGLLDIIEALPIIGNWKCLLMGKGTDEYTALLRDKIYQRKLEDRIILTGYVDADNMPKFWNAVDCAVHVPRTTLHWQETFSLAIVQAMACGKPVIGNTSGSIPYQIGNPETIVPEGNIEALSSKFSWLLNNPTEVIKYGKMALLRAKTSFGIGHLNNHFEHIIAEIQDDIYDVAKIDMVNFKGHV